MSRFYTHEKISLCKPSWKNVKLHDRDSNHGPSACRVDALTTALRCSFHPQRRKQSKCKQVGEMSCLRRCGWELHHRAVVSASAR